MESSLIRINPDRITIPPEAACVPELSEAQFRALTESIRERGIETPLRVSLTVGETVGRSDGQTAQPTDWVLISGRHRLRAALGLGLSTVPCVEVKMPRDLREAMIEEAVVCRDLPRAGRAALLLDIHPELLTRKGKHSHAQNGLNLKKGNVSPSGQRLATRDDKGSDEEETITSISNRYGLHKDYLSAVIEARLECRDGSTDWDELRGHLCLEPMAPSRVICCLRGIQSQGVGAVVKAPGKAGADYNRLALAAPVSLGNAWERWTDLTEGAREMSLARWSIAASHMPSQAIDCLAAATVHWNETDRKRLFKGIKERMA